MYIKSEFTNNRKITNYKKINKSNYRILSFCLPSLKKKFWISKKCQIISPKKKFFHSLKFSFKIFEKHVKFDI